MIYNIVCVSDEGYSQHAAVMLESLFETNTDKQFKIFYLAYKLKETTKEKLRHQCNKHNNEIFFIEDNYDIIKGFKVGQWNSIMYLKLLTPEYLPKEINKYLFLDVDMVINADINPLYNYELNNNIIAACEDIPDCILHKKRLGLPSTANYINSGVIVVDLEKWRRKNISWIEYMRINNIDFINDQDVIASYFMNEICILPIKWNMVTFYYMRKPKIFDKYLETLKEDKKKPGIIHFACPIKPWYKDCTHPFSNLYHKYLSHTAWKNYKFPYYEKLTPYKRIKKTIRIFLNNVGILKDEIHLIH